MERTQEKEEKVRLCSEEEQKGGREDQVNKERTEKSGCTERKNRSEEKIRLTEGKDRRKEEKVSLYRK